MLCDRVVDVSVTSLGFKPLFICPGIKEVDLFVSSIGVVRIAVSFKIHAVQWLLDIPENMRWNRFENLFSFRRCKTSSI